MTNSLVLVPALEVVFPVLEETTISVWIKIVTVFAYQIFLITVFFLITFT